VGRGLLASFKVLLAQCWGVAPWAAKFAILTSGRLDEVRGATWDRADLKASCGPLLWDRTTARKGDGLNCRQRQHRASCYAVAFLVRVRGRGIVRYEPDRGPAPHAPQ
jgi:hypothetical protein